MDRDPVLTWGISSLVWLYRPRWDLVMTASVVAVAPVVVLFLLMRNAFISGLGQVGTDSK